MYYYYSSYYLHLTIIIIGVLNPSVEEKDLKTGAELELPLWLALECAAGRQPVVTTDLPKVYREAYREILKADATAVDLHKFSLYFYELGSYVKHLDRRAEVHDILLHVSTCRSSFLSFYARHRM